MSVSPAKDADYCHAETLPCRDRRTGYYFAAKEIPGVFYDPSGQLGLIDGAVVDSRTHGFLFNGFDRRGRALIRTAGRQKSRTRNHGKRRSRVEAWDAVFSAPKSVSAIYAVATTSIRKVIEECQMAAVRAALDYFNRHHAATRVGLNGHRRIIGAISGALFTQGDTRPVSREELNGTTALTQPHLHTHANLYNLVRLPDDSGAWPCGALDAMRLFLFKHVLGTLYRVELARLLELRLGLRCEPAWERKADGTRFKSFKVSGVPQALCAHWSERNAQAQAAERRIVRDEEIHNPFRLRDKAVMATRRAKDSLESDAARRARWADEARAFGFTAQSVTELCGRAPLQSTEATERALQAARQRIVKEIARRQRQGQELHERDIARIVATELQCIAGADRFENELARSRHHVRARQEVRLDDRAAEAKTLVAPRHPSTMPAQTAAANVPVAMPAWASALDIIRSDIASDLAAVRKHALARATLRRDAEPIVPSGQAAGASPSASPPPMSREARERQILDRWSRRRHSFEIAFRSVLDKVDAGSSFDPIEARHPRGLGAAARRAQELLDWGRAEIKGFVTAALETGLRVFRHMRDRLIRLYARTDRPDALDIIRADESATALRAELLRMSGPAPSDIGAKGPEIAPADHALDAQFIPMHEPEESEPPTPIRP